MIQSTREHASKDCWKEPFVCIQMIWQIHSQTQSRVQMCPALCEYEIIEANRPWFQGNVIQINKSTDKKKFPFHVNLTLCRQKSLITPRTTTSIHNRPLTAEPYAAQCANPPTQPPSPCRKAWASGAQSPLVRKHALLPTIIAIVI